MLFLIVALACFSVLASHQLRFFRSAKKRSQMDWGAILDSVEAVNLEAISLIASLFLSPTKDQFQIEPPVMWEMLGGIQGLSKMRRNAAVMLELCLYADRWGYEGELIAQLIRTDARNLRKAIWRIQLMLLLGIGKTRAPFALMEAAAHYILIQRRLFSLYENNHVGRVPELTARFGHGFSG